MPVDARLVADREADVVHGEVDDLRAQGERRNREERDGRRRRI
jgi:hypothetical protein